jgi:CubicO group peptidase (beta-lactamase class C family)
MATRRPGAVLDLLRSLPRARAAGRGLQLFHGESCLLGALVVAATGRPLADYFSEIVWGPAGMEADAGWQLESEDGLELAGMGVSARLRDMGRFGLLVLEEGEAFNGRRVLPRGWRDLAGQPDNAATAFGRLAPGSPAGYGYHWWSLPGAPFADGLHAAPSWRWGHSDSGSTSIRPSIWSSSCRAPGATRAGPRAEAETVMLLRSVIRAVRPDPT